METVDNSHDASSLDHDVSSIGTMAGLVWKYLSGGSAVTLSKLARDMDAPRDLVMQAVGWLAREGKIVFHTGPGGKTVSLTEAE